MTWNEWLVVIILAILTIWIFWEASKWGRDPWKKKDEK